MSEPKLISPLLDGFAMGNPMSDHDGVRCCPAIKENTEKKYIVKIISVPESQVQMDALLLAGAFKDPAGAMDYYKELSDDITAEAELLQKLSQLEGFLPYEGWQIEPITRKRLGYEVYLISSYKRSLEKHLRRSPVTHLEAMNLGIDICAALNVCRQAGSIYVDLKPSNIFMSDRKEYRIGDLGFLSLNALSYSTLPNKYRSSYTPPEFDDPMAPLNSTADTYALGMILYQLYNDSQLPLKSAVAEGNVHAPIHADYELAEIILKAIHADPQQRWQDPAAMGQALISYMQRNVVNDDPITPYTPLQTIPVPKVSVQDTQCFMQITAEEIARVQNAAAEKKDPPAIETVPADESLPSEEDAQQLQPHEMSDELSKIVAKADDLIAHEMPEEVVMPEPPEQPDPFAFAAEDEEDADTINIPLDPVMEEAAPPPKPDVKKKKSQKYVSQESKQRVRRFFTSLLVLIVLAAVGFCGYLYYHWFYLLPIDGMTIDGTDRQLTVTVDTDIDESRLQILCTDTYGNSYTAPLVNGQSTFDELLPNTMYTIELKIEGFHKLSGENKNVFTTDASTQIVSFTAVTGPEDGSAVISFTSDGEEPDEWAVLYSAEGEDVQRETFTGHSTTITGLSVGKVYTFTLTTADDLTLSGETELRFMGSRLILAQDISVSSENGTDMTVSWNAPGDVVVDSWDVRCYNIRGFEVQFTVDETQAIIPGVDLSTGYTIEITAAGMTQPARISISENPANVTQLTVVNEQDPSLDKLTLRWDFIGDAPDGGWLLLYTVDGAATPTVVKCEEAYAKISPMIPNATYRFSIQAADGSSVFNNAHRYECPEASAFKEHGLSADSVTVQMLKTPSDKKWRYETINDSEFTDTFQVGEPISLVLRSDASFYHPGSETRVLYVYRDTHGNVIPGLYQQDKCYWKSIWSGGDAKAGELNVPIAPTAPGSYVLELYLDGMIMASLPLTIQ